MRDARTPGRILPTVITAVPKSVQSPPLYDPAMVQQVDVRMVDDLDGSDAVQTVEFALDGQTYNIDLNAAHGAHLRSVLQRYIASARVVSQPPGRTMHRRSSNKAIHEWANANGHALTANAKIPGEVRDVSYALGDHTGGVSVVQEWVSGEALRPLG